VQRPHGTTVTVAEGHLTITSIGGGGRMGIANISAGDQATIGAEFKSEGITYLERGTLRGTITGTATPQRDGSFSIKGDSKTTGGTGLYRGATGSGNLRAPLPQISSRPQAAPPRSPTDAYERKLLARADQPCLSDIVR
jgi:hypothetical protein